MANEAVLMMGMVTVMIMVVAMTVTVVHDENQYNDDVDDDTVDFRIDSDDGAVSSS